jgi:nucleolar pre-ribosomal-associated protein 1
MMGKRTFFDADSKSAYSMQHETKRQRIEGSHERNSPRPNGNAEEIANARQLQKALLFDQNATSDFRSG